MTTSDTLHHDWSFEAIGTNWWIGVYQPLSAATLSTVQAAVATRIEEYDRSYSRFRSDSLVTRMSQTAGVYDLPPDGDDLLRLYRQLYDISAGQVTPLIGQVLSDAGYDANYSLKPGELQVPPEWDEVLEHTPGQLHIKQPALLDFGAAGKGYLIDIISELLIGQGITSFLINGSGDMRSQGLQSPQRIGMEQPGQTDTVIGVIDLHNQALCASAPNRRSWAGYHHIMDPHTLQSVQTVQAVWVLAAHCAVADGLATALFFTSAATLAKQFEFEYCLLRSDNSAEISANFPAELFTI